MIISDLQYIESVDNSEVQGAGGYGRKYWGYYKKNKAYASADAGADAYGDKTFAKTNTYAVADSDYGYSGSSSSSEAGAKTKYYYY